MRTERGEEMREEKGGEMREGARCGRAPAPAEVQEEKGPFRACYPPFLTPTEPTDGTQNGTQKRNPTQSRNAPTQCKKAQHVCAWHANHSFPRNGTQERVAVRSPCLPIFYAVLANPQSNFQFLRSLSTKVFVLYFLSNTLHNTTFFVTGVSFSFISKVSSIFFNLKNYVRHP